MCPEGYILEILASSYILGRLVEVLTVEYILVRLVLAGRNLVRLVLGLVLHNQDRPGLAAG